jgi:hypothetical protein
VVLFAITALERCIIQHTSVQLLQFKMNKSGGIVVGSALKVVNGSLHYPSVNIGMMAGFTKLVSYISVSCLISI